MSRFQTTLACLVAAILVSGTASEADEPRPELELRSPDGAVSIAANQIRSYDWGTHTLTLVPKVRDELAQRLIKGRGLVSGVPFVVAIGGEEVYRGKFTTAASSLSMSSPIIVVDAQAIEPALGEDMLRIQLGYPSADFFHGKDPRGDERIKKALIAAGKLGPTEDEHCRWIADCLRKIETIKPGMTRQELLKIFQEEGGLSTRTQRRYAYRGCPYIKVDVSFEAVVAPDDKLKESPSDKITKISRPFLEWSVAD